VFDAPKKVDDEWNLSEPMIQAAIEIGPFHSTRSTPDFFVGDIPALSAVVPAPVHAEHAL